MCVKLKSKRQSKQEQQQFLTTTIITIRMVKEERKEQKQKTHRINVSLGENKKEKNAYVGNYFASHLVGGRIVKRIKVMILLYTHIQYRRAEQRTQIPSAPHHISLPASQEFPMSM